MAYDEMVVEIDNSQFTIHNFRASREQSRIHSDFAEAQPKIEANASIIRKLISKQSQFSCKPRAKQNIF